MQLAGEVEQADASVAAAEFSGEDSRLGDVHAEAARPAAAARVAVAVFAQHVGVDEGLHAE